jgi:hypothetical protein
MAATTTMAIDSGRSRRNGPFKWWRLRGGADGYIARTQENTIR